MHRNHGRAEEQELAAGTADNGTCHYLSGTGAHRMARQTCENAVNLGIADSDSLRRCRLQVLDYRPENFVSGLNIELDELNPRYGRVVEGP